MFFEVLHQSKRSRARLGKIHTPHGVISTPAFVAVGTNGTIKGLSQDMVDRIGLDLIFCNTYHLMVQPGTHIVRDAGGLHSFTGRRGPMITDSGGFQVFSLSYGSVHKEIKSQGKKLREGSILSISEEGVLFRSYRDGSKIFLTPESSVAAQKDLGADLIIPLDELPPYHISPQELRASLDRTHRWELRSLASHLQHPNGQAMYGVIHGGIDPDLRTESCRCLTAAPFDGFAIGGSVGKNREELKQVVAHTAPLLPYEKPIHLLGIGDLPSLEELIPYGIDSFDSSYPTKAARHGWLFTRNGSIKIEQGRYRSLFAPIDPTCNCLTCQTTSAAYLHHLFKAHELTAYSLATIHNLHYMVHWMEEIRTRILRDEI